MARRPCPPQEVSLSRAASHATNPFYSGPKTRSRPLLDNPMRAVRKRKELSHEITCRSLLLARGAAHVHRRFGSWTLCLVLAFRHRFGGRVRTCRIVWATNRARTIRGNRPRAGHRYSTLYMVGGSDLCAADPATSRARPGWGIGDVLDRCHCSGGAGLGAAAAEAGVQSDRPPFSR